MKPVLLFIFMFFLTDTIGQHLTVSGGLERTVAGTESQIMLGYENRKEFSFGPFYQSKIMMKPFTIENGSVSTSWYGIYLNAPLVRTQKVSVYAQLRTGLADQKFIKLVPSLETKMKLTKVFSITIGSSFRHTYPAFLLRLNISLFNHRSDLKSPQTEVKI